MNLWRYPNETRFVVILQISSQVSHCRATIFWLKIGLLHTKGNNLVVTNWHCQYQPIQSRFLIKRRLLVYFIHFRALWFIVHVIGAIACIFIVSAELDEQQTNPFVTTLYDTAYPISDIGFPAVYLCHNNIISRTRAEAYAQRL